MRAATSHNIWGRIFSVQFLLSSIMKVQLCVCVAVCVCTNTHTNTHSHKTDLNIVHICLVQFIRLSWTFLMFVLKQKASKTRTVFNDKQKTVLKQYFAENAYSTKETIKNVSQHLGLSEKSVSDWFSNQRQLSRKEFLAQHVPSG